MAEIWLLELVVPKGAVDPLIQHLEDGEIIESSSSFEHGGSEDIWKVEGYTQTRPANAEVDSILSVVFSEFGIEKPEYKISQIEDIDWVAESQKNFDPVIAGKFFIHASWRRDEVPDNMQAIEIDPQRAFGTGSHETTKGCTLAMQELDGANKFLNILDMGCGSGILAIVAAKLWPDAKIIAVDNDPVSVETAAENAKINNVNIISDISGGYNSDIVKNSGKYDLILSNILAAPLIEFAKDASYNLADGGYIVLAGLMNKDADVVIKAYEDADVAFVSKNIINDWTIITMKKG